MADTYNVVPQTSPWSLMNKQNQDPQSYEAIQSQMNALAAQNQQMLLNQSNANLGMQKALTEAETPVDYSSLMALADSWAGPNSKLAANYKVPESALQRRQMLAQLQDHLNKSQEGMSQNQISLLKAQLETQARKDDREAQRELNAALRGEKKQEKVDAKKTAAEEKRIKHLNDAQDGWVKDPIAKDATAKYYEIDGVKEALGEAKTNPVLKGILPAKIARLQEKGVLTDQDIARYSGSSAFAAKWKQYWQAAEEGTITDENLGYFEKVAEGFARDAEKIMNERANLHARQYSKQVGITPEQALEEITGGTISPDILKPRKDNKPSAAGPRTKVGDVFTTKSGKKVRFLGGDDNDPKNYEDVQ